MFKQFLKVFLIAIKADFISENCGPKVSLSLELDEVDMELRGVDLKIVTIT